MTSRYCRDFFLGTSEFERGLVYLEGKEDLVSRTITSITPIKNPKS